jgi:TolA-binding protein
MIAKLKLAGYVIFIALAIWFGREFHASYTKIGEAGAGPATNAAPEPATNAANGQTNPAVPLPSPAVVTNQSTNNLDGTNDATGPNVAQPPVTPAAPATNAAVSNATAEVAQTAASGVLAPNAAQGGRSVGSLAAFVGALVGLGVLIAYDLTQYIGSRVVHYLFDDQGEGMRDPEYERAEQTWVNGKPLEAIEMMREYLKKHPREQFVALRIAEIYEKDLHNYVAASLEYEEVLKKRLPGERWGWAAIHLCNLYSRLGKQDQMKALLERIARDYPKTSAARKARRNLGLPEPEEEEEAAPAAAPEEPAGRQSYSTGQVFDLDEMIAASDEEVPEPPAKGALQTPEPPKSNLPPGFRKK